jgi:hypothetical protein
MSGLVFLPAALAPLAVALAALVGGPIALPILASLAAYPVMARLVVAGRQAAAALAVLLWAAALSGSVIAYAARHPDRAGSIVVHGPEYRDEMFEFLRTGLGREAAPEQFIPQHLLHLGAFTIACALSGGLLGIGLGAVMVGYMSYYVGALAAGSPSPWFAMLLGWPPYAVLRVAGFVVLGVALSRPVLSKISRRAIPFPRARLFYVASVVLLAADPLLKTLLARPWATLLRPCLPP